MNRNINAKIAKQLSLATSKSNQTEAKLMQSTEAIRDKNAKEELAKIILAATKNAHTVEDLLHIERTLQTLDKGKAVTPHDQTSIKNAERDYAQITDTIDQMRTAPDEYFKANRSLKETGGDVKKMPRSRGLQQINGNKARMQNRASFADENNRLVWDARIALAEKTASMLKTLHDTLAAEFTKYREM